MERIEGFAYDAGAVAPTCAHPDADLVDPATSYQARRHSVFEETLDLRQGQDATEVDQRSSRRGDGEFVDVRRLRRETMSRDRCTLIPGSRIWRG